jgi:hypothetical protein
MLGGAAAHLFFEQNHQIIPIGIIAVGQLMDIIAGILKSAYAGAQKMLGDDTSFGDGRIR